ncbi:ABC transporter [Phlyctema vagabunda]|uniref:ABC transporter n=1 Tax=Phlyctema vagabunda TaxID=108571 RepID=A0ABR4P7T2_9HELO
MSTEESVHIKESAIASTGDGDASSTTAKTPDAEVEDQYASKSDKKTQFSDYFRIFALSTVVEKVLIATAMIAAVGTGVTLPLMNVVFGNLAGDFSSFDPSQGLTGADFRKSVNRNSLYIVYLFIGRFCLGYISVFGLRMVGIRLSASIRLAYLKALFKQPISILDSLPPGQTATTITATANTLQIGISEKLGTLVQFTTLIVTAVIVAFKYSWALTLVTSSVLLFIMLVYGYLVPIMINQQKQVDHANEKASAIASETFGAVRMIVACGAEQRMSKRYSGWVEESRRRGLKMSGITGFQLAPVFFATYATLALAFWFGVKLYRRGDIDSVGTVVVVVMSVMMVVMSMGNIAAPVIAITKASAAASEFFTIIDAPVPSSDGLKEPDVSAKDNIVFDSVTFAYPSRPHIKILDSLDITFEAGKLTAIVGASGSGKSTITGLIERWYVLHAQQGLPSPPKEKEKKPEGEPPEEETKVPIELSGSIKIGGHNLDDVDLKWWRSSIGLVQQEPFIFNDTIFKNVEYGLIGSKWENAEPEEKKMLVESACKEAFADEYINRLPMGYSTQVGDSGIKLSGGQRQRLAIARAIVKQPSILILDEATSSIDVRGEQLVQAALDKASHGRTTITIAHRLSTIKKADKIVVLRKGQVIEQGTHEGLLQNEDGAYWALVNAQKLSLGDSFEDASDLKEELAKPLTRQASAPGDRDPAAEQQSGFKPRGIFRSFGLLLFEQKSRIPWYFVMIIGCMGAGSGFPLQAYLFANIITVFNYTGQKLTDTTNHWALMFVILAIGVGVSYYVVGFSANVISIHISCTYRQQYFESILAKQIPFYDAEENSSGTLTGRVSNDPTQLQQLLGLNIAFVYIAMFNMLGCVIIAFSFGWKLSLLTVSVSMPVILAAAYYRLRYELQFERLNQAVFADSSKFASEAIGAFRTVTALTLEDMICRRYEVLLSDHVDKAFRKSRLSSVVFSASDSLPLLCMALTFWYGGTLLARGEYGPVAFFVVYMAIIQGSEGAGNWLSFGPNMAQATAAANRILSFRIRDDTNTGRTSEHWKDSEGGVRVELRDLWFKYPTRDVPIFTGLNLTIEKGQFAALVGASGCGKTSIVSLLERFYEPQKGKVLFNDTNISDLDIREYRNSISLVAQEPTLFQGTIKENILLGVEENTKSEEDLHRACRDAEIHDFIMSLPEGYNTDVGSKGIALSGGQKQRIAIARALIRDPSIMLLDEATSSLDSESEKLVQAAFERAGHGRTMVVVAHRLATVQNADVIFVLGEGKVLEKGDHNSLLRRKGVYYQMCQSQALDR